MSNKYDVLFKVSFLTYLVYLLKEINTVQKGADSIFFIGLIIIGVLYQLCYIVFLRKRSDIKISRAIARYFLYTLCTLSLTYLVYGIHLYFFGYDVYSWILPVYIKTVYGMEALQYSWYFMFAPVWVINGLYAILYCFIQKRLKNKSAE